MEGEKGARLGEVTLTSGLWLSKYDCGGQAEPCQTLKSKVSCELHKCIYMWVEGHKRQLSTLWVDAGVSRV